MSNPLTVHKAGLRLPKRKAGEIIFIRGRVLSKNQFLCEQQIATLQEGLDRPGRTVKDVLFSISDVGVSWLRWWNGESWLVAPRNDNYLGAAPQLSFFVRGFPYNPLFINRVDLWSFAEEKKLVYSITAGLPGTSNTLTRSGDSWVRRLPLNYTIFGTFVQMVADDFRAIVGGGAPVLLDQINGELIFQYPIAFTYPIPYVWTGSEVGTGQMGGALDDVGGMSARGLDFIFR